MATRYDNFKVIINKIARLIHKIEEMEMKKYNLKSQHISCLYFLYQYKSMRAKEIVEVSLEDKGQVSRSLDFLEKGGYVLCNLNGGKRYNAEFVLTQKGMEISKLISEKVTNILERAIKGLNKQTLDNISRGLYLVGRNLENIQKEENENVRRN